MGYYGIGADSTMVAGAAPCIILSVDHNSSANRILLDIPDRAPQVKIIERRGIKPTLLRMPINAHDTVHDLRVTAMHRLDGSAQAVGFAGDSDNVYMVRHQAPGENVELKPR